MAISTTPPGQDATTISSSGTARQHRTRLFFITVALLTLAPTVAQSVPPFPRWRQCIMPAHAYGCTVRLDFTGFGVAQLTRHPLDPPFCYKMETYKDGNLITKTACISHPSVKVEVAIGDPGSPFIISRISGSGIAIMWASDSDDTFNGTRKELVDASRAIPVIHVPPPGEVIPTVVFPVTAQAPGESTCFLVVYPRPSYEKAAGSNDIHESGYGKAQLTGADPNTGANFECDPNDIETLNFSSHIQHFCQRPFPWNLILAPPPQPTHGASAYGGKFIRDGEYWASANANMIVPLYTQGSDFLDRDGVDCGQGTKIRVINQADAVINGRSLSCWIWMIAYYPNDFQPDYQYNDYRYCSFET